MKKFWFFDLDGTLADTDPDIRVSWKAALQDLNLTCPTFDRDFVAGPTLEEMAKKLLPGVYTDEIGQRLRERFGFHYDNDGFPNTTEYPGVLAAVRRLKASGAKVYIATNKRYAGARAMARHFGWDQVFDGIFTGDMHKDDPKIGKMRKPELLKFILKTIGAKPEACVMVGDTDNDMEAAEKNGITSVFVTWGYGDKAVDGRRADVVIDTPDLPRFSDATAVLRPGRDGSVKRRHPWIFSGAIANADELAEKDGAVAVVSAKGETLGWGYHSPASQIRVRLLSFDARQYPSEGFIRRLIRAAVAARPLVGDAALRDSAAARLINAENDGLPGVVADVYAGHVVLQLTSAFAERSRDLIVSELMAHPFRGVSVRDDVAVRAKEGLSVGGFTHLAGEEPPETITIDENGVKFLVDVRKGHKTGYYLDQREARRLVGEVAFGDVLNCFSYTGGFGICAAKNGARSVVQVDVSGEALRRAQENAALNGLPDGVITTVEEDVFAFLRRCRDAGRTFDTIVLDPPKFAETKAQVMKAARGYKDINLLAIKLLRPGGVLATFSCSSAMTPDLFDKIVAEAAVDAKADLQIICRTNQTPDHPVSVHFPEGHYLKGLILRKRA